MDEEFDHDDPIHNIGFKFPMEMHLNWATLREQKLWLIQQANNNNTWQAEGLLGLLDYIQDTAVDSGAATEEEVFGHDDTNENA